MRKVIDPSKELRLLLAFFGDSQLPRVEEVAAAEVPPPYRELLVHHGHMTVALEQFHKRRVEVHPYHVHQHGEMYGRKLDLTLEGSTEVVMTGAMLFNLSFVREDIRAEIVRAKKPLGRLLIENGVLLEVTSNAYLRVGQDDPLVARFSLPSAVPAYGRLATIFCDEKPAVDLLEIVRP